MANKKKFTTTVVTQKSLLVGKASHKKTSRKIRIQYVNKIRRPNEKFRPMRFFPYLQEQVEKYGAGKAGVRDRVVIRFVSKNGKVSLRLKHWKVFINHLNNEGIYLNKAEKKYPFFSKKRYDEDTMALEEEALGEVSGTVASRERQSLSSPDRVGNAKAGKRLVSKSSNGKLSKSGQDKNVSTSDEDDAFVNVGPRPRKRRMKRISSGESSPASNGRFGSPSSIAKTIELSDSVTTSLGTFESEEDMDSMDGSVQMVEEAIIGNVSTSSISSSSTLSTQSSSNLVLSAETTITTNGGYVIAAVGEIHNHFVAPSPSWPPTDLLREEADATAAVSPQCKLSTMPSYLMETFLKWLDDDDNSAVLEELADVRRRAASFRQRHFDPASSCRTAEFASSQSRHIPCPGNHVFHCPHTQRAHKDSQCHEGSICWKETYHLMGAKSSDMREQGKSLQAMVEKLPWKTNAVVGLLEIKLSETLIPRKLYQTHSGPLCRVCERRVSRIFSAEQQSCYGCSVRISTEFYGPTHYHPIVDTPRVTTYPETLYYLCFRMSSPGIQITKKKIKALRDSIAASELNPGPFGQTNRPGYPQTWRVAGKFCSASCAMSPLSMMFVPTMKQLKDVYPLSCLSDAIVNGYYPGNTVVIAMSHPANFCVGHQDLAALLDELCRRGIPLNCLFFYYHGIVDKITGIKKGETIVSGSALLSGIRECVPRYGIRPAVSGVLYAAEKACQQRLKGTKKGRNKINENNCLTASQQLQLKHDRRRFKLCAEVRCDSHIGAKFALRCVRCTRWFHGECVNVTHSMLVSLHKHRLAWICRQCNIGRLLDANQVVDAVQLAYAHRDSHIYTIIASQYSPNFDWTPVFTFMGHVSIVNDQMDLNSLMVCAIYFGVDVLKRNPALTRLPQNAYRHLFMKYVVSHSHVDESVVRYLLSVTMNVVGASSFGTISQTPGRAEAGSVACLSSSSLSSPSLANADKTLSASAIARRSLETTSASVPHATAPVSEFLAKTTPSHVNCSKPARRSKLSLDGRKVATAATTRTAERDIWFDSAESM